MSAKLADRGANIVVTGPSQGRLERATTSLPKGQLLVVTADVTDTTRMRQVVDAAVDRFGHLDVVFANAGTTADPPAALLTMDPTDFERVVEVDLLGVWRHPPRP